jgi:hypothetical protein
MTLEDFLAREEEARVAGVEGPMAVVFPDAAEGAVAAARRRGGGGAAAGGGRGRKRALMDPMDRAATQRQKRMIKNRESAARSRERKQVGWNVSIWKKISPFCCCAIELSVKIDAFVSFHTYAGLHRRAGGTGHAARGGTC